METELSNQYPLHNAVRDGLIEECKRLIGAGADINLKDSKKRTPLHIASWKGNAEVVRLLVQSKCKLSEKALDGFTALHFATMQNNCEVIELLVKAQKSLLKERVVKGNKSALHMAIAKGNVEMVKTLIDLGADVTAKTGGNKNVLELSTSDDMYKLLKSKYEEHVARMIINKKTATAGNSSNAQECAMETVDTVPEDAVDTIAATQETSSTLSRTEDTLVSGASFAPVVAVASVPVPAINTKKRKVIVAHLEFDDEEDV